MIKCLVSGLDTTNFLFFSTARRGVQLHEEGRHLDRQAVTVWSPRWRVDFG
jgi:hypothetical protein